MPLSPVLAANADGFLSTTNVAYEECAAGIGELDRIVVNVSSALAARARTYLIPALYAYWERFFRVAFTEFVRCAGQAGTPVTKLNHNLARFRLARELREALKRAGLRNFHDLASKNLKATEAKRFFEEFSQWFDLPLAVGDPTRYVETNSNVHYQTLEQNCENLGIDVEEIKAHFPEAGRELYPSLKELVDSRNMIAHGQTFADTDGVTWSGLKEFCLDLMNSVQLVLYDVLRDEKRLLCT